MNDDEQAVAAIQLAGQEAVNNLADEVAAG